MYQANWSVVLMLSLSLVVGGGGSRYGIGNAIVQLTCMGLLVWHWRIALHNWALLGRGLRVLIVLTLGLPFVQLLPLPPAFWHSLPGREAIVDSLALLDAQGRWFPLTFDRGRTLIALASLIPPLAILLLFNPISMPLDRVVVVLSTIVFLGLISFFVGAIQVVSAEASLLPYPILVEGRLYGLFASHNTSGIFFVVALISLFGLVKISGRGRPSLMSAIAIGAVLILGVILTQSRSSIFLACVVLFAILAFAVRRLNKPGFKGWMSRHKILTTVLTLNLGLALVAGYAIIARTRIASSFARFSDLADIRPEIWTDTIVAIREFFPMGTGMGSFDEVFQAFESLEIVRKTFARRAHNDYLELGLEAGVFGWALLIVWFIWCARLAWKARGSKVESGVLAAVAVAAAVALQSGLDYPLRNQGMLAVMGAMIAVLGYARHERSVAEKIRG